MFCSLGSLDILETWNLTKLKYYFTYISRFGSQRYVSDRSKPFEVNLNTYRWSKRSLTICKLPFWLNDSNSCIRNHIRVCHIHETRWPRDFNSDISTFSSQSKMCCKRALTQIVCTGTDFLRLQDGGNCQSGWITLSKLKPNIFYVSKAFQA